MLRIARSASQLDVTRLMDWYADGKPSSQQAFYGGLLDFFSEPEAFYALWEPEGVCVSAVRVEPFRDGMIVAGLVTDPMRRGCGHAGCLLTAVVAHLRHLGCGKVYSHVDKRNRASLAVHGRCGFCKLLDHAVYLDGSVSQGAVTLCIEM